MPLAAALAACGNPEPENVDHLANAQRFYRQDKLKAAHIELKNALRQDPDNAQARLLLGRLYLDSAMPDAAETELLRAQSEGVSIEATEPLIARALLEQGRFSELLNSPPLRSLSPPARAELLSTHALAQLGLGRREEAQQTADKALETFPTSVPALTVKARLAAVQGDLAQTRALIERVNGIDPRNAEAWSLLGDVEQNAGNPEAAEAAFTRAIENRLYNARDLIKRALVRIDLGKLDAAGKDVDDLERRFPDNPEAGFLRARLAFARGDFESARERLARAVEYRPSHGPTLFYLGAANFRLGNLEEAGHRLTLYLDQAPGSTPAREMLAQIRLSEGNFGEAERLLRPVTETVPDDAAARTLLASALLGQGAAAEARTELEQAVALQPASAQARLRLGRVQLALGDVSAAQATLARAVELDPQDEEAYMLLGRAALAEGDADRVLEVAERLRETNPDSATALNMIGSARLAKGETAAAREAFVRAAAVRSGDAFALHSLASLALQEGNIPKARGHYQTVLEHDPGNLPTLLRIAELESALGKTEAALATLERAAEANPDSLEPPVRIARHYLARNEPKKAQNVLNGVRDRFGERPDWLTAYAQAQLADDPNAALQTLSRAVERSPRSVSAHYLLALAYGQLGRVRDHAKELDRVLELDPNHLPALLARARTALRSGDPAGADAALRKAKAQMADEGRSTELAILEGRVAAALGQPRRAETAFRQAFEQEPATRTLLPLSQQLWDRGRHEQSMALLRDWLRDHPEDTAAMLGLASAYLGSGRDDEALALYRRVLEVKPSNLDALNNAAWLLRTSDPQGALRYAAKARAIAPDSPDVMDTIGVVAMEAGDFGLAGRMLKRALERDADRPGIRFHYAQLLARTDKSSEAREVLSQLLSRSEKFSERDEARALLARLEGR
jgi:putative PEP-CTERM system TPR-repeat lipoprotein